MRQYFLIALILALNACNNNNTEKITAVTPPVEEKPNFLKVTSYIKGEIFQIKEKMQTPIKYTTINDHMDSVFLKFEDLNDQLKEFVQPVIDSANLSPLFTETKFVDQTINAITFTYDPKVQLPDSISLRHWDVYVEPETGKITRVYMVKKASGNKTLQLTWESGKSCKTTTLISNADGNLSVEKEEKISWDY
jgi:hypothetical protein